MVREEQLLNQQVINNRTGDLLTIVGVTDLVNISETRVSFDNGKTYVLMLAIMNNIIKFVDEEIQKAIVEEISAHNNMQNQIKIKKEEINRQAIEKNRIQAEIDARNKPQKRRGRGSSIDPNIRKDRKNVAYKATYCDGNGDWFKGPCSASCREMNCSKNGGGRFCSTNSACRKVIDGLADESEIKKAFDISFLCYESKMLIDYKIYAGRDDDGTVRGWSLDNDRLVILTTVKPYQNEEDRVIFGAFLINHSYDKDDEEASATSYPDCRIALSEEEADQMKYWDYAPGEGANNLIQWKEGLLRYQTDEMCATVLRDLVKIVEKRNDIVQTEYAKAFLRKFLQKIGREEEDIPEKSGARIQS